MSGALCVAIGTGGGSGGLGVTAPNMLNVANVGVVAFDTSTATATGGSGSYTYSWTTSGAGITYDGQSTQTLGASKGDTSAGTASGGATVTVTDTVTGATGTHSIFVSLQNGSP